MLLIGQPHCHPVTDCRVFVIDVSLYPENCLSDFHGVELVPQLQILFDRIVTAWTWPAAVLELLECGSVTGAHVCCTLFNQLPGIIIIDFKPVGLIDYFIRVDTQPFQIFWNHLIGRLINPFRVCVLNP